jgi:RNA polymerase sigma-70 factor (ECF subfamily)
VLSSQIDSRAGGVVDPVPEQAFRDAAVACLDSLYGFALALCRDSVEAEDLVQETYLRALRAPHKAEPGQGLRNWMFVILHNIWRNDLRRRRSASYEGDVDGLPSGDADPLQSVDRKQSGNRLRAAIEALPGAFREVIVLRCVEGFSYREMAQIVGCPAGTVMSRLARARAQLRRELRPVGVPASKSGA